jgi:hypothetical protein
MLTDAVALILGAHRLPDEVAPLLDGDGFAAFAPVRSEQRGQHFQARQALVGPPQREAERQAGADALGGPMRAVDQILTLVDQHQQVFFVILRSLAAVVGGMQRIGVALRLPRHGAESRCLLGQRAAETEQVLLHIQPADPVGQHQHCLNELVDEAPPLVFAQFAGGHQLVPEADRVLDRDLAQPDPVVLVVEHDVQAIAELAGVLDLGQQTVADDARQLREETCGRQNAAVGEVADHRPRGNQLGECLAQPQPQRLVGIQQIKQCQVVGNGAGGIVGALRPHDRIDFGEQAQRVAMVAVVGDGVAVAQAGELDHGAQSK